MDKKKERELRIELRCLLHKMVKQEKTHTFIDVLEIISDYMVDWTLSEYIEKEGK